MAASCCPPDSLGALNNSNYTPKGIVEHVETTKIDLYCVGESEKCIIWNYDIMGIDGGRTKQMADVVAEYGYMVIIPDYFRADAYNKRAKEGMDIPSFVKSYTSWDQQLNVDWEKSILPYATKRGASSFGAIGFCWGSYMVAKLSADTIIKAGVSMHPSHPFICVQMNDDEESVLKDIKCPQLFLPAASDATSVKFGGLGKRVLGDALEVVEFPDMQHGWSVRGDLKDPIVERDVKKAFNLALAFLKKYM